MIRAASFFEWKKKARSDGMKYIIDGKTMKAADGYTIGTIGLPSLVLMERAALKVVEAAEAESVDLSQSPRSLREREQRRRRIRCGKASTGEGKSGDCSTGWKSGSLYRGDKDADPHF